MKITTFFAALCLCWSQLALAAPITFVKPGSPKPATIRQLVDQYYRAKDANFLSQLRHMVTPPPHCNEPGANSCVDAACTKLGTWGCDDLSEIKQVGAACRGNYDGACLEAACTKLGTWGCDDMSEITSVARACVGNYDTDCFESVCQRLGTWGCDDMSEVTEVLKTCSGN